MGGAVISNHQQVFFIACIGSTGNRSHLFPGGIHADATF